MDCWKPYISFFDGLLKQILPKKGSGRMFPTFYKEEKTPIIIYLSSY